jgi:hypothetical protein
MASGLRGKRLLNAELSPRRQSGQGGAPQKEGGVLTEAERFVSDHRENR